MLKGPVKDFRQAVKDFFSGFGKGKTKPLPQQQSQPSMNLNLSNNNNNTNNNTINTPAPMIINNNNNNNNTTISDGGQAVNHQNYGNNGGWATNDVPSSSIKQPKKEDEALNSGETEPPTKPTSDGGQAANRQNNGNLDQPNKAMWALGRIAGDSTRCRDLVLDNEALPSLLSELNEHIKPSLLERTSHTLFFCCVREPFNKVKTALPALGAVMQFSNDEEILSTACYTLQCLCDRKYGNSQAVIEAGAFPWLLKLLQHPSPKVLYNALNAVKRIVDRDTIKIQAAIDSNIIGPVIHLLQHVDSNVKSRAADVIRDALSCGTCEQIKYFVSQGCIKPLYDLLICSDEGIVMSCVDGLNNILKAGEADKNSGNTGGVNLYALKITEAEGWKEIKNLQFHDTKNIKDRASMILKTYIGHEYED